MNIKKFFEESKVKPGLAIIQVGNRDDSNIFIRNKVKAANYLDININVYKYNSYVAKNDLINRIKDLNNDKSVHGIVIQLPFDTNNQLIPTDFIYSVLPDKDVDGI